LRALEPEANVLLRGGIHPKASDRLLFLGRRVLCRGTFCAAGMRYPLEDESTRRHPNEEDCGDPEFPMFSKAICHDQSFSI
jgi:hypothetical protein